jgi:hypothetical protein
VGRRLADAVLWCGVPFAVGQEINWRLSEEVDK